MLNVFENIAVGLALGVGIYFGEDVAKKAAPKISDAYNAAKYKAEEAQLRLDAWRAKRKVQRLKARVAGAVDGLTA